jgi:hypothetical protein
MEGFLEDGLLCRFFPRNGGDPASVPSLSLRAKRSNLLFWTGAVVNLIP